MQRHLRHRSFQLRCSQLSPFKNTVPTCPLPDESRASVSWFPSGMTAWEELGTRNNLTSFSIELIAKMKFCQFAQKEELALKFAQEVSFIIWILLWCITLLQWGNQCGFLFSLSFSVLFALVFFVFQVYYLHCFYQWSFSLLPSENGPEARQADLFENWIVIFFFIIFF